MWLEILTAYLFIVIAELGDKSQILAMTLATKYRTRTVLIGVFLGVLLNHVLAIAFGSLLQEVLTPDWTSIVVGLIFLLFGLLSLFEHPHQQSLKTYRFPAFLSVATLFFFGELGDKTQFATMALSLDSEQQWMLLLGTVPAMLTTSIIAIWVGKQLGRHIPELPLKVLSTFLFIFYGTLRLSSYLLTVSTILTIGIIIVVATLYIVLIKRYQSIMKQSISVYKQAAKELKSYYTTMTTEFDELCLTEHVCGVCQTHGCILGHVKYLIEEGKAGRPVSMSHLRSKTMKQVDTNKLYQALEITVNELQDQWTDPGYLTLHQIRQNIEFILFQKSLRSPTFKDYQNDIELLKKKTHS